MIEIYKVVGFLVAFALLVTAIRIAVGHYRGLTEWYNLPWERWIAHWIW